MKLYLASLAIGILVGSIYAVFGIRSPAPPVIALVGLFGILVGEQLPPLVTSLLSREPMSWHLGVKPHLFGQLPKGDTREVGRPSRWSPGDDM